MIEPPTVRHEYNSHMGRLSCREVERQRNWRGEAITCMLWGRFSCEKGGG